MFFKNKKALELPITAIIVLIIAVTFLGLAIFFIKTMWSKGTEQLESQFSIMDAQTKAAMERTGESVSFSFGDTLEVKKGQQKNIKVGIRNSYSNPGYASDPTKKTVCHRLAIKCLQAMGENNGCPGLTGPGSPVLVGGEDELNNNPEGTAKWFTRAITQADVPNNEFVVFPATVQISAATPDTYLMEAELLVAQNKEVCTSASGWDVAGSKRFNIELS